LINSTVTLGCFSVVIFSFKSFSCLFHSRIAICVSNES